MQRTLSVILALFLMFSLFAGCGRTPAADENNAPNPAVAGSGNEKKLSVVSTLFPGYDFTREIAGDEVNLTMLLPPGSESHSFEPTPQDIISLQNCDVFIYAGGESDTWLDGILDSMDTSETKIISMMDWTPVVEEEIKEGMEDGEHDHEDEHDDEHDLEHEQEHAEYDEHVWTSPVNAMRITEAISDALCALDERNADAYRENCAAYIGKLEELDASLRDVTRNAARNTLIFGDRFPFRYFVDEYGLDYYAAFPGCSTETEAGAKTMAFLIDKVNAENIPVVFYIELSNEKIADAICESTGAKKRLLHSCHNVTKDEMERGVSYLELMTQNAESVKEALS